MNDEIWRVSIKNKNIFCVMTTLIRDRFIRFICIISNVFSQQKSKIPCPVEATIQLIYTATCILLRDT